MPRCWGRELSLSHLKQIEHVSYDRFFYRLAQVLEVHLQTLTPEVACSGCCCQRLCILHALAVQVKTIVGTAWPEADAFWAT